VYIAVQPDWTQEELDHRAAQIRAVLQKKMMR